MSLARHSAELVELLQHRYPDWQQFDHDAFAAAETAPIQKATHQARTLLGRNAFKKLLDANAFDVIREHIITLSRATSYLYLGSPTTGDLAIVHAPSLSLDTFCHAFFHLLHGDAPIYDRFDDYVDYVESAELPNRWPFPTYFLFLLHPNKEVFVKPRTTQWLLKFLGTGVRYASTPSEATYSAVRKNLHALKAELKAHQPRSMIDVVALTTIAYRVSRERIGRLSDRAQVDLDQPPTVYDITPTTAPINEPAPTYSVSSESLSRTDCAAALSIPESTINMWLAALERKGQAIFYGPPGTGKTFAAQQLAAHLTGGADGIVETLQFHSAYAYEDFVTGIRPKIAADGRTRFVDTPGRLLTFCQEAAQRTGICTLILDELNRADLARVFGEALFLLEYREQSVTLANGQPFTIPSNVRFIGTMNSADRSLALVDFALRRRFAFFQLSPNYDALRAYLATQTFDAEPLITQLTIINRRIDDPAFHIGHAFFMVPNLADHLETIWCTEIEPTLVELFTTQPEAVAAFRWNAIKIGQ